MSRNQARPFWTLLLVVAALALAALFAWSASRAQDASSTAAGTIVPHEVQLARLRELERRFLWKGARRHFARAAEHAAAGAPRPGARVARAPGEDYPLPEDAARRASPFAAQGARAATAPVNVRANDPAGDAAGAGQSEESLASLGDDVLVAWNDGQGFTAGGDVQGWGYSTDGGATFHDGGAPPHPSAYPSWSWTSDPVVSVNEKTGRFYYCGLADVDATHNGIGVAYGHFAGASFVWDGVSLVRSAPNATTFLDKQWIAADSSSNSVYVTNTTFTSTDWIDVQRSTDGGATWSAPAQLSSPATNGMVQGSRPVVGPNGEVYVTWLAMGSGDTDDFRFRRSLDRGVHFDAELTLASFYDQFGTGAPGFNRERGIAFPSIAVDRTAGPHRGRIYAAWAETWDALGQTMTINSGRTEIEPDDAPAGATAFLPGNTLRGTVASCSPPDLDYWKVTLAAGQAIVFWADSMSAHATYTLRLFAPAPDDAQRLAYGAELDSTSASPSNAFFSFTAPVDGTYLLRIAPATSSPTARPFAYRILTAAGGPGVGHGRDQRDVLVCHSDGGATWSAPFRVNDEAAGFDDFLPEIAVGADGDPYVAWFDFRNDRYGSRADQYVTRSADGGDTWQPNARLTTATGNFTTCGSNIAPNMGDYSSTFADGNAVRSAWADARGASVDVWTTALETGQTLAGPAGRAVGRGDVASLAWTVGNRSPLFASGYSYSLASARDWPLPPPGALDAVAPLGSGEVALAVAVPDTAAAGPNRLTLTVRNAGGALVSRSAVTLDVSGTTGVGPLAAGLALAPPQPNPSRGPARIAWTLPREGNVTLRVYGIRGEVVRTLAEGPRAAGTNAVTWDGTDETGRAVPPGTYFVRLQAFDRALTRRIVRVN